MAEFEPYDVDDPFNVLADRLRRDVAAVVLKMQDTPAYRRMTATQQIEVVVAGLTTAVVGCGYAMIRDDCRPALIDAIRNYLPLAAANSAGILAN